MTKHTVALILYVVGAIAIVVGLLDILNLVDYNEGTGWGLLIGGIIAAVVGAIIDDAPRRHRL